jgi:hypothetical protein
VDQGVVYAEFLIAFLCFFVLFMASVQLAVLASARLVVQHAATLAVRAAVVTIDDDPAFYAGEERKRLDPRGGKQDQGASRALELLTGAPLFAPVGMDTRGSQRLSRVRNAAYLALAAVGPSPGQVARWLPFAARGGSPLTAPSLGAEIGDSPGARLAASFAIYDRVGAAIVFPERPGGAELASDAAGFADDAAVTVRVVYLFPCGVPLARELICRSLIELGGVAESAGRMLGDLGQNSSLARLNALWEAWRSRHGGWSGLNGVGRALARAEWSHLQLALYAHPEEKFAVLEGEASLPNHGAAYRYYSELERERAGDHGEEEGK